MAKLKFVGKKGRTKRVLKIIDPTLRPILVHLVVTRQSGDTETTLLGKVPNLMTAIEWRRKIVAVPVPKRFMRKWVA